MIIDAHTHRYPEEVIADPTAFANRSDEPAWLGMVMPSGRPSLQGWSNGETMLNDMDAAGVESCLLLGWYWEHAQTCIEANKWHKHWIKQDPDRFIAFLSIKPNILNLTDYLKKAKDDGFRGIGESHPWVQGFSMNDPLWMQAMEFACEQSWPVNFHVTDPHGKNYPGKVLTPMDDFIWLAKQLPDLKIVLAHAGGLWALEHDLPENIYYDLAACPLLYQASTYQKLINAVGPRKILWGTDYPLRIYPSKFEKPNFISFLQQFKDSVSVSQDELDCMLGGNLRSIVK